MSVFKEFSDVENIFKDDEDDVSSVSTSKVKFSKLSFLL